MEPTFPIFGLDLSAQLLRVALLQRRQRYQRVIGAYVAPFVPLKKEDGTRTSVEELGTALKDGLQSLHVRLPRHVAVAIPDADCFVFTVNLHQQDAPDVAEAVRWEAGQHIPFELEDVALDWQILDRSNDAYRIQVAASQKGIADMYARAVDEAGYIPVALVPASLAALHTVAAPDDQKPFLLVTLEEDTVNIAIVTDAGTTFTATSEKFTGQQITQLLMQQLKLSFEEAEKAKYICGVDPSISHGVVRDILGSDLAALSEKIREVHDVAVEQGGGIPCDRVLLTGPESLLRSVDRELHKRTDLDVSLAPLRKDLRSGIARMRRGNDDPLRSFAIPIGLGFSATL